MTGATGREDVGVPLSSLPTAVTDVLGRFLCCEAATLGRDGTPLAWPAVALMLPDRDRFLLTTSIGFPVKAANIRRDPRVSLLYSDPTGSGLVSPPAVLVQGTATVADDVRTWGDADLEAHWRLVGRRQPASKRFSATAPGRWFMDWYYMRLMIYVRPMRVTWWPGGDTTAAPQRQDTTRVV